MAQISKRLVTAWEKFNEDVQAFKKVTGDDEVVLYEDANTPRYVKGFALDENGHLTWVEDDKWEDWYFLDDEECKEWLSFWRANLRRGKRYWNMDAVELDRMQEAIAEGLPVEESEVFEEYND